MKNLYKIIPAVCILYFANYNIYSQNNALQLNGAIVTVGATGSATSTYLIINQNSTSGITRSASGGYIVSEGNYNYVQWNMGTAAGNYVYPFGYSGDYIPFSFTKPATATTATVQAATYKTAINNTAWAGTVTTMAPVGVGNASFDVIDRWWILDGSGITSADLNFDYRGLENTTTLTSSNFLADRWSLGSWDTPVGSGVGVTGAGNIGSVNTTGVSPFGPWILVEAAIMPIELLDFNAILNTEKNAVDLTWTTSSEKNNDYFTIEKSVDGINFESIATIDSKAPNGNSSTNLNYKTIDEHPFNGVNYYRLKQTDLNGNETYSKIVTIKINEGELTTNNEQLITNIYPNPATDNFNYTITSSEETEINVSVIDVLGQIVISRELSVVSGVNKLNMDVSILNKGSYFVQFNSTSGFKTQKQLVIK